MEVLHQQGEIIGDRYQIVTTIGKGGMATTYAAIDLDTSQKVALKVISFLQVNDWKVLELFEREAQVLANLNHPFIPQYIDYFERDLNSDRRFYLIQELVIGESLASLVEGNWRPQEAEVKNIAAQLLDILIYLHSLSPPVIHRDIKPQNIIRSEEGKIYLVDFGAVQAVYRNTISISGTFVGTLGYMSPEQLRGNVLPQSDLYSLGCSLIFLLTGKLPTELPQKRMKIDFQSEVDISTSFANWLDKLLEPAIENRFQSASVALSALKQKKISNQASSLANQFSHRIKVENGNNTLKIKIRPQGLGCVPYVGFFLGTIWSFNGIFLTINRGSIFTLIFGVLGMIILGGTILTIKYHRRKKTVLEINPQKFQLTWTSFHLIKGLVIKKIEGLTDEIDWVNSNVDIDRRGKNKKIDNTCAICEGDREHKFGKSYNLTLNEVNYLTHEISTFLKQIRY